MKTIIVTILIVFLGFFSNSIISAQPNPAKVIEQMQKFNWMIGDWKGDAWYLGRDQVKTQLTQQEHIISRLDGSIITMEGTGYDIPLNSEAGKIVFQAFGIFTYDQVNSKYVLRAYQGGNFVDSDLIINEDGSYTWGMELPYGKSRFTLRLTGEGKWNEIGEFSRDGGSSWVTTFEMNLTKLK
jgi:hypothetical protein